MSSGLGLRGNVSRCFYFFQDFAQCMKTSDDPMGECRPLRNDYLECLHHKKEYQKVERIQKQKEVNAAGSDASGHGHGGGGGGH